MITKNFVKSLQEYLTGNEEFEVTGIMYNGHETFEINWEKEPDVVVLDIIMPHLDGIGVLEKLNSLN